MLIIGKKPRLSREDRLLVQYLEEMQRKIKNPYRYSLPPLKSKRTALDLYHNSHQKYPSSYQPKEKFRLSYHEKRWIRLNFRLFLLIGLPILLFVPPINLLFNSIASITEAILTSVINISIATIPLGIIVLIITGIFTMCKR